MLRIPKTSRTIKTGSLLKSVAYIVIAGLALMLAIRHHTALSRSYHNATTHQAETYTELYLDNNTKLPTRVTIGKSYTYRVRVANHESGNRTYTLLATVTTAAGTVSSTTKTVSIAQGKAQDVPFTLSLAQLDQTAEITVTLQGTDQYVTFRSQS
ncbi:MAG TPA: DUF1616 domain-containing protein [Candidatus Saccharimonadales bacterium]|nr:DUF1616 domain-containing protein [Candidatus Saccharimonadales bacterium]